MISPVKIWRRQKKISSFLGKEGRIVSWTLVHVPSSGFEEEVPYAVILVALEDGQRMVGQLVDFENKHLKIDRKVKVIYRRMGTADSEGIIPYGLKFKPVL